MITPEPPAGSEHYREGWRHGYEQAAIDRERSADAVTAEARVLVARCDNYREDVDAPCTGEIRFRWGMSQSDPCDVCGSRCGIAVAKWERVETAGAVPDTGQTPADTGCEHLDAPYRRLLDEVRALRRVNDSAGKLLRALGPWHADPAVQGAAKELAWMVNPPQLGPEDTEQATGQAPEVAGPLVAVRVGSPGSGYLVGPFTPAEAVSWRIANVTVPGMQWAIVPLLPDAARPTAEALLGTDTTPDRLAWISEAGETAAAERQSRYQETACARRPAEETPDA